MAHTIYTFTLHRLGVLLVAVGALFVGGLLFAAGWLVGSRQAAPATSTAVAAPVAAPATGEPTSQAAVPPAAASTAPGAPPPASAEAAPADGSALLPATTFALEVGVFVGEEEAKGLVSALQQRGFEPVVVEQPGPRDHTLFRVMVGSYASRLEATQAAEAFFREEDKRAVVVEARLPKPTSSK